jgi:hypothetical protein
MRTPSVMLSAHANAFVPVTESPNAPPFISERVPSSEERRADSLHTHRCVRRQSAREREPCSYMVFL